MVVMLVGGQTRQGRSAAASHTGSLASGAEIWRGLARQTGIALTRTLDEFLDVLLAFQVLAPRRDRVTRRCVLFGNGGGTSVLAADAFGSRGLDVTPMPAAALEALGKLELLPGTSVVNPIDAPAYTLRQDEGRIAERILDIVLQHGELDAVVMHINVAVFLASTIQGVDVVQNFVDAAVRARARHPEQEHFVLVLRSDGAEAADRRRRELRDRVVRWRTPPMRSPAWLSSSATSQDRFD
ncbi:MAG: hypothetical protein EPO20_22300 [Betaproteobacteria bacterium]|nr:MAG: hypothetical protein EPO20_22300 [Betaproteobacteria bacterium]